MPDQNGDFLPGLKPVVEMLRVTPERIARIYIKKNWRAPSQFQELAARNSVPIEFRPAAFLDKLCGQSPGDVSHQGVVALVSRANFLNLADLLALTPKAPLPLLIALDHVQDPGNLGTLARTAYALGCAGMLLPKHNSASLGPGALKSSAGALTHLPVCVVANIGRALDKAEEAGLTIYGAGNQGQGIRSANAFTFNWQLPAALVLGGECKGIRPAVAKRCSTMLAIPLERKFDSLNVSQAGAILIAFCAASRQTVM